MKGMKYLSLILVCLAAPMLGALDFQIPEVLDLSGFGSLPGDLTNAQLPGKSPQMGSLYGRVPRSDIVLESATADIEVPASGTVIYVQADAPVKTIFSFPLGGALAILHPESYVSLISGLDAERALESAERRQSAAQSELVVKKGETLPGGNGSGVYPLNDFGLRLFDAKSSLWVNPIFLASWIHDRTPPVIRSARLARSDGSGTAFIDLSGVPAKDRKITCPQGSYRLYIDALDIIIPGSPMYSAPYRILAVLDGKSVVDSSLMAAKSTEAGLSFLENPAPSRETLAADGSYSVGQIVLARGEHDLQLQVSDYAGNTSTLMVFVIVR